MHTIKKNSLRIIPLLLEVVLAVCSAACSKTNETPASVPTAENTQTDGAADNSEAPAQPGAEAEIGAILNAPEAVYDYDNSPDEIYLRFLTPDGENEGRNAETELALRQKTEDVYELYCSNGLLKLNEFVLVVGDDTIERYWKDAFSERFTQDTETSQKELQEQKETCLTLLNQFLTMDSFGSGLRYKKQADGLSPTGREAYSYEVLKDGETMGFVLIDKDTGVILRIEDPEHGMVHSVEELRTQNVEIPAYN